ncbi:uncharacterized protein LOC121380462 isoform X2 [Gigantopelta aegis]|uniref:uncharacterized protein LOC121380462 isoform X2 n=1 Tax=Gigantopelta aegis TaxID=1735272 RepID=UPI001B88AE7A|nr:uncharacterized protein LOC121380462 isoform X2 [Gigantopelta aegis]
MTASAHGFPPMPGVPKGAARHLDCVKKLRLKARRFRKRLSILLHTHVVLILVSTLAALDASCVIGQIICDILIMKEELHEWHELDANLTKVLIVEIPRLNSSHYDYMNLEKIYEILTEGNHGSFTGLGSHSIVGHSLPVDLGRSQHGANDQDATRRRENRTKFGDSANRFLRGRQKRSAGSDSHGKAEEHSLLEELTHAFHLGSMAILSALLLETILKSFAMGRKILHHKLECFDCFVVAVSWSLDVAFWEGIWAKPGTEAATILIFILPWRVVRIVNSFVLVIQQKDHVQLKIIKQRLRGSVKKTRELAEKSNSYKLETKHLQGVCRKHGATEKEIHACGPGGKRRKSSILPGLESFASLALASALGSHPSLAMDSSSSDEEHERPSISKQVSLDPSLLTLSTGSLSSDVTFVIPSCDDVSSGHDNPVFEDDMSLPTYEEVTMPQDEDLYTHL